MLRQATFDRQRGRGGSASMQGFHPCTPQYKIDRLLDGNERLEAIEYQLARIAEATTEFRSDLAEIKESTRQQAEVATQQAEIARQQAEIARQQSESISRLTEDITRLIATVDRQAQMMDRLFQERSIQ